MRRGHVRRALCAAFVTTVLNLSSAAAEVVLTPDQLTKAAVVALESGDAARALAYADALVGRNSEDFTAQLVRARALRDLGRNRDARNAAWDAVNAAEAQDEKYAGAMVMAQVQSSSGRKTLAQYWLRRAVELAPNQALETRAIRDFKYLRTTNPWSTRVTFSVTPDSNINDGSARETSFLNYELTELLFGEQVEYQLTGAALALPGIEYTLGLDTRYRVHQTGTSAHDLFLKGDLRHYTLTEEGRRTAPGVSGDDFAFASVFAGYGYRWLNLKGRGETALRVDAGHSWYGGSNYADYLRASVYHAYIVNPRTKLGASLNGERQMGIAAPDLDTAKISMWGGHRMQNGHSVFWSATGAQATSPLASEEFTELQLRGSFVWAQPVFGATAQFGMGLRTRDYNVSPHSADGRRDDEISADLTLIFKQLDYHGFNPTVTIYGSQKNSNIALYESNKLGINFGIQSAF